MATLKITRNINYSESLVVRVEALGNLAERLLIQESAAASEGHDPVVDCAGPRNKLIPGGIVGELDAEVLSLRWHSHMTPATWDPPQLS